MMKVSLTFLGATLTAASLLLIAGDASAASGAMFQSDTTEVCIDKEIETMVTSCPTNLNMKRFKEMERAKVSTRVRELEKKTGKAPAPSVKRKMTDAIIESAFKKQKEKKKISILKDELRLLVNLADSTANDDPAKADVLKRVADGYKNYFDQLNYLARDLDEKIFQAKKKNDTKTHNTYVAQQKKLETMARGAREASIKAYIELRNHFPDYPDYDEILFAIAYELDQLAVDLPSEEEASLYRKQARDFYNELIRNHPRSRFIPHAWMAFGEFYFFEDKNVDKSLRSYQKVTDWGPEENPNYVIALYYQAWCLYNMSEHQKSIDQFVKVIDFAKEHPEDSDAASMARRSKLELVDPFSKIGNPSQAWEYFLRVGGDQAHAMLVKLANRFYDEGQWTKAIVTLHKLQALEVENYQKNNGDELCWYQHLVTNSIINSKPKRDQLVEMQRQLAVYKKFKEEGNHAPQKVKKCAEDTIDMTWDQATHWHAEAVGNDAYPGTKEKETIEVTIGLYDTILSTFGDLDDLKMSGFTTETRPTRYRVAYYVADLYWTLEAWRECGPAFDRVLEIDPAGSLTAEAAYGAVLCYNKVYAMERADRDKTRDKAVTIDDKEAAAPTCDKACKACKKQCSGEEKESCIAKCAHVEKKVLRPHELTELENGILKSYQRYVCFVNKGEDLVNIKYRRARIYYEANQFAEAAVLFKDIALHHPDSELALFSANLYLDSLNALGDMVEVPNPACYDDLASIVDVFMDKEKEPGLHLMQDEAFAAQMKSLKVGVMRKKAEALNKRGRFKESAEIYLNIYRNYQGIYDDKGMCEVLFNTAINMEAGRLIMPAIRVREKMIELYPNCEHSKKASYYIGQNYHALQEFSLAAENYLAFAKKYSGEAEAPEALSNTILFYIGLGEYEPAWSAVKMFEKLYQSKLPDQAASVFFSAGHIYLNDAVGSKRADLWDLVRKHYLRYLKVYSPAKLLDEQVQAHVFIGDSYWNQRPRDMESAEKAYRKAIALFEQNAMEQVPDNKRKADLLNAATSARFAIAEWKYDEFTRIRFPEFVPEKEVPERIEKWWKKKVGKEAVASFDEMRKYRRIAVNWGEMDRKEAKQETKREDSGKQFDYWLETRFKPWIERKTAALDVANKLFSEVVNTHVPEWEMAAAARAGDMQVDFMTALYEAPLPPSYKDDEELTTIYRQSMDEMAQPFRDVAIKLYDHCLNISTKVRWFNESSKRCEAGLNKLDPNRYPISEEIRLQPDNEIMILDIPGPILERPSLAKKQEQELKDSTEKLDTSEPPPTEGKTPQAPAPSAPPPPTARPSSAVPTVSAR